MKQIITLFFLLSTCFTFAQNVQLQGTVLDSLQEVLVGASVILKHGADDKMEAFGISDAKGGFKLIAKSYGEFKLQITYIGYGTFERALTLKAGEDLLDFGAIVLRTDAYMLDGVTIQESFIPISLKKDTIEYNAAAFKTRPNATVEDLLKKLPGINVEKDGTIKAQEEEVETVLVDGKEFFDDDPKIATRNIPAEVIDKVQLFDRKSDFSEFTGMDDGNEKKTINLAIKEGKNKGLFGNVKASYGTEDRYSSSSSLNRFNDKMQLSFVGNLNNINEQAFSLMDYLQFTGGLHDLMSGKEMDLSKLPLNLLDNAGNNDLYSGGLNFNYDFSEKTELRSNYFFNLSKNKTDFASSVENVLGNGSFINQSVGDQSKQLSNHRFKLKLQHKFDKTQDFSTTFSGGFSEISDQQWSQSKAWLSNAFLVNHSLLQSEGNSKQVDWISEFVYRKKLNKKGRFLTAGWGFSGDFNDGNEWVKNEIDFYESNNITNTDSIDQKQKKSANSFTYKGSLNYVESLGNANYLNFVLSGESSIDGKEKIFSDRIGPEEYKANELLSSDFKRDYFQNQLGIGFKRMRPKYSLSTGVDYQLLAWKNTDETRLESFNKRFVAFLPKARYSYQLSQSSQLSSSYSTRLQAPTIDQLQPVLESSSLTNAVIGNPDLSAEYIHLLDLTYSKFDRFYFRSLFAGFRGQYAQNPINYSTAITDDLLSVAQPVNSEDEWMLSLFYDYESPVESKNLKFSLNGDFRLQRSNVLVNSSLDRTFITSLVQKITLENKKKKKLDWSLNGTVRPNITRYKSNSDQSQTFFDYTLSSDVVWFINRTWFWEVNLEHEAYSATRFGQATQINYIHTSLNKTFKGEQFMLTLKGVNLLNENSLVQRNSFGNQYNEMIRNRLGRYFLLGLTYKIRSFGK